MTRRGYLEKQNGTLRMLLGVPGADVDDPDLTSDKIAFDSGSLGNLTVWKTGEAVIENKEEYEAGVWIASGWNLNYVPLCLIRYALIRNVTLPVPFAWVQGRSLPSRFPGYHGRVTVTPDGIYICRNQVAFSFQGDFPILIQWAAFRLSV